MGGGDIAVYMFLNVDCGFQIVPTGKVCLIVSRILGATFLRMVIQEASREFQQPSQAPGLWAGMVAHTKEVVYGLVSQYRWNNTR